MGSDYEKLKEGIILSYEINVTKWVVPKIKYSSTRIDIVLTFHFLLTQIYFELGVLDLLDIHRFLRPRTRINLGLIRDVTNPVSRTDKLAALMVSDVYEVERQR